MYPARGARPSSVGRPISMSDIEHTAVVIIGGGAAGVAAAAVLSEAQIPFVLLEAAPVLGGRMRETQFQGRTVETGAAWIHGTSTTSGFVNPLWGMANAARLRGNFTSYANARHLWRNGSAVPKSMVSRWQSLAEHAFASCEERAFHIAWDDEETLRRCFERDGYRLKGLATDEGAFAATLEWLKADFETLLRPDHIPIVHTLPLNYQSERGRYDKHDWHVVDPRGFATTIRQVAQTFQPASVRLRQTVVRVQRASKGVIVTTAEGLRIGASYAICTLPLGVLKRHTEDAFFEPPMPEDKVQAVGAMHHGHYAKVFLVFDTNFWDARGSGAVPREVMTVSGGEIEGSHSYLTWALNLDHPKYMPGSRMLAVHMTGRLAEQVETQPARVTEDEVMRELRRLFPQAVRPSAMLVSNWSRDPRFHGSYSAWPLHVSTGVRQALTRREGRLLFAGEHCAENYGYVHGALDSGASTARQILHELRLDADSAILNARLSLALCALAALVACVVVVRSRGFCEAPTFGMRREQY